jgi:hypothetical protein
MNRIIIHDPKFRYPIGDLLDGEKALAKLHGNGGVTLPVEPRLLGRNGVSGYFRRDWGSGVRYENLVGTRGCPMVIYAMPDFPRIYWAIRAMPIPGAVESRGTFRLATHSGQYGTITGGLSADGASAEFADQELDKDGGVTILGKAKLNCTMEGYLGLCVYGCAVGIRVLWSAVTQTE